MGANIDGVNICSTSTVLMTFFLCMSCAVEAVIVVRSAAVLWRIVLGDELLVRR